MSDFLGAGVDHRSSGHSLHGSTISPMFEVTRQAPRVISKVLKAAGCAHRLKECRAWQSSRAGRARREHFEA